MNERKPTDNEKPLPPDQQWVNVDRPTMSEPQEEFIGEEARPSIDISELRCAQCGKPAEEWDGKGVAWEGHNFCSERCKLVAENAPP